MSKKISFCALMAVVGILSLAAGIIIPTNTIFFYLFSTLFTYICTAEYGKSYGLLTFVVITLVGFIIVPNKITIFIYLLVIGYYPVIKHTIEHFDISNVFKWISKLLFAFVALIIAYFIFKSLIVIKIIPWMILILLLVVFVVYDLALTVGIKFYALKLRKFRN